MIVFDLGCEHHHRFEGWFASSEDFEQQLGAKAIACPLCGNANVTRVPHASYVNTGRGGQAVRTEAVTPQNQHYANLEKDALTKVIEYVIEHTEDVGAAFPEEARKIHYHETPERKIRGTASREEVEALKDEGIEVVALAIPAHRLGNTH